MAALQTPKDRLSRVQRGIELQAFDKGLKALLQWTLEEC